MHGSQPRPAAVRLDAIGLILVAYILFACLDTLAKHLNATYDPLMVTWFRYISNLVLAVVVLRLQGVPNLFRTGRPVLQIFRGAMLLGSTLCNFLALQWLQLTEAVSIMFAAPFLVAAAAGPILGEWVGPRRWAAIGVGFIGVIVVTRPGTEGFHPAMFLSMCSACCYAAYNISTRVLTSTESPATMVVLAALVAVVALTPTTPFVWSWPTDTSAWLLLSMTGFFGGLGHYLLVIAHARAPASALAPYHYSQIVSMAAFGYIFFNDIPDPATIAGATIIVSSGLYLLYRERVVRAQG